MVTDARDSKHTKPIEENDPKYDIKRDGRIIWDATGERILHDYRPNKTRNKVVK